MSDILCSLCLIQGEEVLLAEDGRCPSCRSTQHCYSCALQEVMTPLSVDAGYCPRCGLGIEDEGMEEDYTDDEEDFTDDDEMDDSDSDWDEEDKEIEVAIWMKEDFDSDEGVHSTCTICVSDFKDMDVVATLPCQGNHRFHRGCVWTWLQGSNDCNKRCPNCRERVRR
jgi:Ring finger domain